MRLLADLMNRHEHDLGRAVIKSIGDKLHKGDIRFSPFVSFRRHKNDYTECASQQNFSKGVGKRQRREWFKLPRSSFSIFCVELSFELK